MNGFFHTLSLIKYTANHCAEGNVMRHVPVIIVGGGPVGMVLAMSLAAFEVPPY